MKIFTAIILIAILSGCNTTSEPYIWQKESVPFDSFTTFSWITDHPLGFHQIHTNIDYNLEENLKKQTISLLEEKGMRYVGDRSTADVSISFAVGAKTRTVRPISNFAPAISGDQSEAILSHYPDLGYDYFEGQLCIEFHNPLSNEPLWHGTIDDVLLPDQDVFDEELVRKILTIIISEYRSQTNETEE